MKSLKYLVSFLFILLYGCAPLDNKVDIAAVKQFPSDLKPSKNQVFVYVINGTYVKYQVIVDGKAVVALASHQHCLLKLNSAYNTLVLSSPLAPSKPIKIDNRQGKTLFYYMNLENYELTQIRPALGKTLVEKTDKSTEPGAYIWPDYSNVLLNVGWIDHSINNGAEAKVKYPTKNYAILNIARPGLNYKDTKIGIWDKNGLVALLGWEDRAQIPLSEGKHTFYATLYGAFAPLIVDVKPGREYFAKFKLDWNNGFWVKHLIPIWTAYDAKNIKSFYETDFEGLFNTSLNLKVINSPAVKPRLERGRKIVSLYEDGKEYPTYIKKLDITPVMITADMGNVMKSEKNKQ